MKHFLTIALLLAALSASRAQNCNIVMIDDYCTMIDDDFARYELRKHQSYDSVLSVLKHLKVKRDSVSILYLANCKDMMRFYVFNFTDSLLTSVFIEQPTGKRKKDLDGFFYVAIEDVKTYYVRDIKYVNDDGAAIFDNDCYTIQVSKAKKAIETTIIMK